MSEIDPYVEHVLRNVPDGDLPDFADRLYAKLTDKPTWPFDAPPHVFRVFLVGVPGIHAAIESLLAEEAQKIILDGSAAQNYFATTTPTGVEIVAATDKGGRSNENEDRVAIHMGTDFSAVIDGIGGYESAGPSATILADALLRRPLQTKHAAVKAQARMQNELGRGGACYACARLTLDGNTWTLHRDRKGDCRVSTIDPHSFTVFSQTKDESNYGVLSNAVETLREMSTTTPDPLVNIAKGTIVLLTSDGVHKKAAPEECASILARVNGDLQRAVMEIWQVLAPRMTDHRSIVLMRVPRDPSAGSG